MHEERILCASWLLIAIEMIRLWRMWPAYRHSTMRSQDDPKDCLAYLLQAVYRTTNLHEIFLEISSARHPAYAMLSANATGLTDKKDSEFRDLVILVTLAPTCLLNHRLTAMQCSEYIVRIRQTSCGIARELVQRNDHVGIHKFLHHAPFECSDRNMICGSCPEIESSDTRPIAPISCHAARQQKGVSNFRPPGIWMCFTGGLFGLDPLQSSAMEFQQHHIDYDCPEA